MSFILIIARARQDGVPDPPLDRARVPSPPPPPPDKGQATTWAVRLLQ